MYCTLQQITVNSSNLKRFGRAPHGPPCFLRLLFLAFSPCFLLASIRAIFPPKYRRLKLLFALFTNFLKCHFASFVRIRSRSNRFLCASFIKILLGIVVMNFFLQHGQILVIFGLCFRGNLFPIFAGLDSNTLLSALETLGNKSPLPIRSSRTLNKALGLTRSVVSDSQLITEARTGRARSSVSLFRCLAFGKNSVTFYILGRAARGLIDLHCGLWCYGLFYFFGGRFHPRFNYAGLLV